MTRPKTVGRKELSFVPPCFAQAATQPPSGPEWLHEVKFDGYRLQAHIADREVRLFTRTGLDWTHRFSGLSRDLATLPVRHLVLDGEAIAADERGIADFSALQRALDGSAPVTIALMAFDLLHIDGSDLAASPLLARKERLATLLSADGIAPTVRLSTHLVGDGGEIFSRICALGAEGIVSKRIDRPYRSGRSRDWIKTKCELADPFVVLGFVAAAAPKRAIGSLVLGFFDDRRLIHVGRVGTGFTIREASAMFETLSLMQIRPPALARTLTAEQRAGVHWIEPCLVAQVTYRAWSHDGNLRHAVFKRFRQDKVSTEVTAPASRRRG